MYHITQESIPNEYARMGSYTIYIDQSYEWKRTWTGGSLERRTAERSDGETRRLHGKGNIDRIFSCYKSSLADTAITLDSLGLEDGELGPP